MCDIAWLEVHWCVAGICRKHASQGESFFCRRHLRQKRNVVRCAKQTLCMGWPQTIWMPSHLAHPGSSAISWPLGTIRSSQSMSLISHLCLSTWNLPRLRTMPWSLHTAPYISALQCFLVPCLLPKLEAHLRYQAVMLHVDLYKQCHAF
jgi:hypothetical protein